MGSGLSQVGKEESHNFAIWFCAQRWPSVSAVAPSQSAQEPGTWEVLDTVLLRNHSKEVWELVLQSVVVPGLASAHDVDCINALQSWTAEELQALQLQRGRAPRPSVLHQLGRKAGSKLGRLQNSLQFCRNFVRIKLFPPPALYALISIILKQSNLHIALDWLMHSLGTGSSWLLALGLEKHLNNEMGKDQCL